ncbi:hypothetical protein PCE1_002961 [Barthelona sp. PCE]
MNPTNAYARQIQNERAYEERQKVYGTFAQQHAAHKDRGHIEAKIQAKRASNIRNEQLKQQQLRQQYEELQRKRMLQQETDAAEKRMSAYLKEKNDEKMRDEMLRRRLRSENAELRDLTAKLKMAMVAKEQKAQAAEKELLQQHQKEISHEEFQLNMQADREMEQRIIMDEERRRNNAIEGQRVLSQQISEREERKRMLLLEKEKEREEVERIVAQVRNEQMAEQRKHEQRRQEVHKFITDYLADRQAYLAAEAERTRQEEIEIAEYREAVDYRKNQQAEQRQKLEAQRQELFEHLSSQALEAKRRRDEYEEVLTLLQEEEDKARLRESEAMRIEEEARQRAEIARANEEILQQKRERARMDRQREAEYEYQLQLENAAIEAREAERAAQRATDLLHHRIELEQQLAAQRDRRQQEKELELFEFMKEQENEAAIQRLVEEERQRLLQEFGADLIEYLPKGVIKSEADLDLLGNDAKDRYYASKSVNNNPDDFWSNRGF